MTENPTALSWWSCRESGRKVSWATVLGSEMWIDGGPEIVLSINLAVHQIQFAKIKVSQILNHRYFIKAKQLNSNCR